MYDPKQLYVDPFLSDFAIGFRPNDLIGREVAPVFESLLPSSNYRVFDRSAWLIYDDRREPLTVANEIAGGKWSADSFSVYEHSLQSPVSDEEREILARTSGASSINVSLDPEADATELVTRSLLLGHEFAVSTLYRNTATYPAGHTATLVTATQWDNYGSATSDPVTNIQTAIRTIYRDIGYAPNTMIIPWEVGSYISSHPKIIDRFKNFMLTAPEAFQQLTGFQGRILTAESVYNAAQNIDATANIVQLWGKDIWLGYVDPASEDSQNRRTFARTFAMPYAGGVMQVDRWRENSRKADLVRNSFRWDLKVVSGASGYLIKNVIA